MAREAVNISFLKKKKKLTLHIYISQVKIGQYG